MRTTALLLATTLLCAATPQSNGWAQTGKARKSADNASVTGKTVQSHPFFASSETKPADAKPAGAKKATKPGAKKKARKKKNNWNIQDKVSETLSQVNANRVTIGPEYENQPVVTKTQNGLTYVAWVSYKEAAADNIVVLTYSSGGPLQRFMNRKIISGTRGQYIRPVLAPSGNDVYCFWTVTQETERASIWYSRLAGEEWSTPTRLFENEKRPHQNPEVTPGSDGKIAMAYQVFNGKTYDIEYRVLSSSGWSDGVVVSSPDTDDWDPVLAYSVSGDLHISWSAFEKGDYDIYHVKYEPSQASAAREPRRISARGDYDMHPWLAPSPDGTVWLSWDRVRINEHGYSGNSTITGANRPEKRAKSEPVAKAQSGYVVQFALEGDNSTDAAGLQADLVKSGFDKVQIVTNHDKPAVQVGDVQDEEAARALLKRLETEGYKSAAIISSSGSSATSASESTEHGEKPRWSGIEVRVIDGDTIRIPGNPSEEIIAPEGYAISHRALGKIAVNGNGEPWVVYRSLVQPSPAWEPNANSGYYWSLLARSFREGKWQKSVEFIESDGYLEEPGLYVAGGDIHIAYSSEHRRSTTRDVIYLKAEDGTDASTTTDPIEQEYDHHHDFDGFLAWDGDIYLGRVASPPGTGAFKQFDVASLPVEAAPQDSAVDVRLTREAGRHSVETNGKTYQLLWGDTHRHSNVSRCSVGTEPSPDDLYRYGIDINLYDFVALADHAEHTTSFYWWRQLKTADLYHIPGFMSVLYNYEWSMRFPEGHHNAIFPDRNVRKMNSKLGIESTMTGGWDVLRKGGYKAITAPHTTADPGMGTDWRSHDDQYQRVCEIFQACRGSYEYDGCPRQHSNATNKKGFYWKGLEKGYKMGIICSSDHGYGCAYACVYTTDNTREGVWQAIWDRRCYGSTTYGLVVDVRSGNHWMGEEFSSTEAPKLDVYVRGSAPIRQIDILGRFKVLHTIGSIDQPISEKEYKFSWSDPEWASLSGENWYYVRVIQTDDEMAWASPMWITKE